MAKEKMLTLREFYQKLRAGEYKTVGAARRAATTLGVLKAVTPSIVRHFAPKKPTPRKKPAGKPKKLSRGARIILHRVIWGHNAFPFTGLFEGLPKSQHAQLLDELRQNNLVEYVSPAIPFAIRPTARGKQSNFQAIKTKILSAPLSGDGE